MRYSLIRNCTCSDRKSFVVYCITICYRFQTHELSVWYVLIFPGKVPTQKNQTCAFGWKYTTKYLYEFINGMHGWRKKM